MTWNIGTSKQLEVDLEIFVLPPNTQGFLSIVLDATAVAADGNGLRKLVAGTPLSKNTTSNQYEKFTNGAGQAVAGILAHPVEFPDGTAKSDAPAAMAFHGEVFRADRIVGFATSAIATAIRASLTTCKFR